MNDTILTSGTEVRPDEMLADICRRLSGQQVVILVPGQLMVRRLRRFLQETGLFPVPRIVTESAWIEETILMNLEPAVLPARVLSPAAFARVLAQAVQSCGSQVAPIFRSADGLAALERWYTEAALMETGAQALVTAFEDRREPGLPEIVRAVSTLLQRRNWVPRVAVPLLAGKLNRWEGAPGCIIRWAPDPGIPARESALKRLAALQPQVAVIPLGVPARPALEPLIQQQAGHRLFLTRPADEMQEMVQIFRRIAQGLAGGQKPSDHVILCPDPDARRALAQQLAGETGIPVYVTRGSRLTALPPVRRLLQLLALAGGDTRTETLLQVFGDQQLDISTFSGIKTPVPPMIRAFEQLCRRFNARSLDDMRRLSRSGYDSRGLVEAVLAHVDALQARTSTSGRRPISAWFTETIIPLLTAQSGMGSDVAGNLRNALVRLAAEAAAEAVSLGLNPECAYSDAVEELRRLAARTSEPVPEQPEAVLFTSPDSFTPTGKVHIHLCALTEGRWPAPPRGDFLRTRYSDIAGGLFGDKTRDIQNAVEARFAWFLQDAASVYVSAPLVEDARNVPPAPLFALMKSLQVAAAPQPGFPLFRADAARHLKAVAAPEADRLSPVYGQRLAAWVAAARQAPEPGVYDGMIGLHPPALAAARAAFEGSSGPVLSATLLDAYIASPHGFLLQHLLKLEEPRPFRELLDPEEKGLLVHDIAGAFYTPGHELAGDLPVVHPPVEPEAAAIRLNRLMDAFFDKYARRMSGPELFTTKLKDDIRLTLRQWLDEEIAQARHNGFFQGFRPAVFGDGPQVAPETELHHTTREGVSLVIRPDRVDTSPVSGTFALIDYKTGSAGRFKPQTVLHGLLSQMPLYALVLQEKTGYKPAGAFYWGLKPGRIDITASSAAVLIPEAFAGARANVKLSPDQIARLPGAFYRHRILWMLQAIRNGEFPLPIESGSGYPALPDVSRLQPLTAELRLRRERRAAAPQHARGLLGRFYCAVSLEPLLTTTGESE